MYDNPSWYFLKNFLIGFAVSLVFIAFIPAVTPFTFLILNGMFMASTTLEFFFRKRRNPDGELTTIKDWIIRYILFGIIIGTGLYLMGGLRTFTSIATQSAIFICFLVMSFPPVATRWHNWLKKQEEINKQRREEFEKISKNSP